MEKRDSPILARSEKRQPTRILYEKRATLVATTRSRVGTLLTLIFLLLHVVHPVLVLR